MPDALQLGHFLAVVESFALLFLLLFGRHGGNLTTKGQRNEGENKFRHFVPSVFKTLCGRPGKPVPGIAMTFQRFGWPCGFQRVASEASDANVCHGGSRLNVQMPMFAMEGRV
jgi:hypothetical protein